MEVLKKEWDQSYIRKDNFVYYPKEEVVKFLNRFVRKKTGISSFTDLIDFSAQVRGLDYGCGIGRQTILMEEFGIVGYGLDISEVAIEEARRLAEHLGFPAMRDRFSVNSGLSIPFGDGYFDIAIAAASLDSIAFDNARMIVSELDRTVRRFVYMDLISGDDSSHHREYDGEETVGTTHEFGTIQSYYNFGKIRRLMAGTGFNIKWGCLIKEESLVSRGASSRYYLVLEKPAA